MAARTRKSPACCLQRLEDSREPLPRNADTKQQQKSRFTTAGTDPRTVQLSHSRRFSFSSQPNSWLRLEGNLLNKRCGKLNPWNTWAAWPSVAKLHRTPSLIGLPKLANSTRFLIKLRCSAPPTLWYTEAFRTPIWPLGCRRCRLGPRI